MADDIILLGLPAKDIPVDETCPYTAKLGGVPAWFDAEHSVQTNELICPNCENKLFLVSQVYAPVVNPRTLYIFGCNSVKCGATPKSWRVFRFEMEEKKNVQVQEQPPPAPQAAIGWGNDDSDDDEWGDVSNSTWGNPIASSTSNDVDLEMLLEARNDAMLTKGPSQPSTSFPKSQVKNETQHASYDGPSFPSIYLHVDEEPAITGVEKYNHETNLLNAYLAEEEKENASEAARLRQILTNKSDTKAIQAHANGEHGTESYERTPLREKFYLRFQKRIKRSPNQCLRYNYGGEPLWASPPPKFEIPKCACGEERTFEMQLMPTTNYFLQVENYVKNPIDLSKLSLEDQRNHSSIAMDGGMDWQTIAIWSCPSSCALSNEEFVYVMPPLVD